MQSVAPQVERTPSLICQECGSVGFVTSGPVHSNGSVTSQETKEYAGYASYVSQSASDEFSEIASGFDKLSAMAVPDGFSRERWELGVTYCIALARWAPAALMVSSRIIELFGLHPSRPDVRYDCKGLAWTMLEGDRLISLIAGHPFIISAAGNLKVLYRVLHYRQLTARPSRRGRLEVPPASPTRYQTYSFRPGDPSYLNRIFDKVDPTSAAATHVCQSAAQQFTMIVHELTTHSLAYGALSTAEGRVSIEGKVDHCDEDRKFSFVWRKTKW